jgi:hypothetical protein
VSVLGGAAVAGPRRGPVCLCPTSQQMPPAPSPALLQLLMPSPGRRWKHLKQKQRGQAAQPSMT